MFEALRTRIAAIETAGSRAMPRAAARIQAKLRADATSRIGRVPEGIAVVASGDDITVSAPDFVLKRARDRGQVDDWLVIVGDEIAAAVTE